MVLSERESPSRSSAARVRLVWAPRGRPRSELDLAIVEGKTVEINLIADRERIDQFDIVLLDNCPGGLSGAHDRSY